MWAQQETARKPRIYADPEGRFSFELSGDWVKVATTQNDVVGCFLVTARMKDGGRRVMTEVIISRTEMETPVSLDEYAKAEDRLVLRTPGFRRGAKQKAAALAETPAVRNDYVFLPSNAAPGSVERLVYQVHAVKEKEVWGLTFSALKEDEPFLGRVEKSVVSSFQFSVPEGANDGVPEASKTVTATGPVGGFSLTVPESWQVEQSDEYGLSIRGVECVVYAFSARSPVESPSVQDAAGRFLKERENLNELRVLSQGSERVAGMDGYVVEYSGVGEGRQWRVRSGLDEYPLCDQQDPGLRPPLRQ